MTTKPKTKTRHVDRDEWLRVTADCRATCDPATRRLLEGGLITYVEKSPSGEVEYTTNPTAPRPTKPTHFATVVEIDVRKENN